MRDELLTIASRHHALEEVLRRPLPLTPQRLILSVVVRGKYAHDMVLPYAEAVYLVYDVT